jgi:hypothetical protein
MNYKYSIRDKYGKSLIKYGIRENMDTGKQILTIFLDDTEEEIVRDVVSFEKSIEEPPPAAFYNNGDRYGLEDY